MSPKIPEKTRFLLLRHPAGPVATGFRDPLRRKTPFIRGESDDMVERRAADAATGRMLTRRKPR